MNIASQKPGISSSVFLLICILSLLATPHTINKRMELSSLAKGATEISQPALRQPATGVVKNVGIGTVKEVKFSLDAKDQPLIDSPALQKQNLQRALARVTVPWPIRVWKDLKGAISRFRGRILAHFRPPIRVDLPIKQTDLYWPLVDKENINSEANEFFGLIFKDQTVLGENQKYIQESLKEYLGEQFTAKQAEQHVKIVLQRQLEEWHLLLKHNFNIKKPIAAGTNRIANNIQPILLPMKIGSDPIIKLGKKMAAYKAEMLLKDQKSIQSYLTKDQEYLSELLGFFGPENVFLPHIKDAIKKRYYPGKFRLVPDPPDSFLQGLERIQKKLSDLIKLTQEAELAKAKKIKFQKHPDITELIRLEQNFAAKFGGRDEVKGALNNIKNWDLYISFMKKLNSPKTMTDHQLQFLEPWGYSRQYQKTPAKNQPYKRFGIIRSQSEDHLKIIEDQAPFISIMVQEKLKFAAGLTTVEENLKEILTPEGMEQLKTILKKDIPNIGLIPPGEYPIKIEPTINPKYLPLYQQ
ncbi:hypothetical protein PGTUg99_021322 [Puccinia graminis f. sp. tritici]|uniref:Uncharacterized protein n=1 Tax=Puccinia graminis f. sp. tritici TaxID=56615 RepID=A0A5B0RCS8_PUCGR|nr:hypothetical protein PGTUg99_021322 [Puccinia graminis f. sp. tritici]